MNRAGLLNFWYYDDEVFDFSDGKLLLRGSNGSGKSVTMQSFLPVLLDGKKTPDRLDPFGSRARRMEDYLLGEKEVVDRDERTGYLFIEFKKDNTDQYITTGIGLQAKRNKPMKFWGFVITDDRRIGYDIDLYKVEKSGGEKQKIPRSRIELENVIGTGGHVVQTQKEYMELVNRYIFGFQTLEAYEDLIKLLIQLRSPKLSKDFRPTVIYEILEAALPPLTDEDLRHLSDTIEQMDQTKQQIEQLEREWEAIQKVNHAYNQYNQRRLADQAQEWMNAKTKLGAEKNALHQLQEKETSLHEEIVRTKQEQQQLDREQDTLQKKQERLKSHKIWNLEQELRDETIKLNEAKEKKAKHEQTLEKLEKKDLQLRDEKNKSEARTSELDKDITDLLEDMVYSAEQSSFAKHDMNVEDYKRVRANGFDFTVWKKEANAHLSDLDKMVDHFRLFQRYKDSFEERNLLLAEEQRKIDEKLQEEKEWLRLFEEDLEKKRSEIHEWVQTIDWISDADSRLQISSRALHSLYETSYDDVKAPFQQAYVMFEDEERMKRISLEFQKEQLQEQKLTKEQELNEWRTKKDPQPETREETIAAREDLRRNGYSFSPLYAAVEFQDHVPEEFRNKIEGVLVETGLLDALVMDADVNVTYDRVLTPNPVFFQMTLADYLRPDPEVEMHVSATRVDEVLRSIVVHQEDGHTVIHEDGRYQLGLIKGHALPYEEVRFIGRSARKRYRKVKIEQLEEELASISMTINEVDTEMDLVDQRVHDGKEVMNRFPTELDLKESYRHVKETRFLITQHQEQVKRLDQEVKSFYKQYQEQKFVIDEQARHFNLEKTLNSYITAKREIVDYKDQLADVINVQTQWLNETRRVIELTEQLDDVIERIDECKGELNIIKDRMTRYQQHILDIQEQLDQEGVEDIRKQINEVEDALTQVKIRLDETKRILPEKHKELEYVGRDLQTQCERHEFWVQMEQAWNITFTKEISYVYVLSKDEVETEDHVTLAKRVIDHHSKLLTEKDASRIDGYLTSTFYSQASDLMEYRMKDFQEFVSVPEWMANNLKEEYKPFIEQWKLKSTRRIIDLDYQGKRVSPYYIQEVIEKDRNRYETLLNEQDQELYEEILFRSVGSKLRSRIRRAEEWTKKMNHLMETRNTSSGLTFTIRWKPRTAEVEAEMDTKDLVDLLKLNARLLKEEDLQQITTHFRSKIANAKQLLDTKSEGQTLLQVLKEVLDYRKWFSFVLSYRRENEPKRELTNHAFYKFSGGEKAMAMYIPLFTACYSRYQEADASAPYIISLDEAFAGVDENNIREMFEIVERLGFNYIMNSQVLWGDYETISSLSICELVRPKNADFVSVIRYQWNGKKLAVNDLKDLEEEVVV